MDNLTHTLIGASIASIVMGRRPTRRAIVAGAIIANLPDLDVFIPHDNIIDAMTYHRGFTHSLFFETLATPVIAYGARYVVPAAREHWPRFLLVTWLCLITHALLDSLTTYGTNLFWPFNLGPPVAFASIFIIDPLFTGLLLVAVVFLIVRRGKPDKGYPVHRALFAVAMAYLAIGMAGHVSVDARAAETPSFKGKRILVQPGPLTILYWQVLGVSDKKTETGVTSLLPFCPIDVTNTLSRMSEPPDGLAVSPAVARLEWFTAGFFGFSTLGDRLDITDLRIGVPPGFGFSYQIAEERDGRYRSIAPRPALRPLTRIGSLLGVYTDGWANLKRCLGGS